MLLSRSGNLNVIEQLLQRAPSLDVRNDLGETPLVRACFAVGL